MAVVDNKIFLMAVVDNKIRQKKKKKKIDFVSRAQESVDDFNPLALWAMTPNR